MNEYVVELIKDKQLSYGSIYTLSLIELGILKAYIKTYLKTEFFRLSRSSVDAPIFFDKKLYSSFYLWVDYLDLNYLIMKNLWTD